MKVLTVFFCLAALPVIARAEVVPDPDRGVYAIWARDHQVAELDFVKGGQIFLQWKDLQTGLGEYDFDRLDAALKKHFKSDRPATIQVNGNRKPEFLYGTVPLVQEKLSKQIRDDRGSLMYWHPNHADAYLAFVRAYGEHICRSPYRNIVLGIRLNFNALGTEHLHVPKEYHKASRWRSAPEVPTGADWNRDIMAEYKKRVIRTFIESFRPHTRVFVRNNVVLDEELDSDIVQRFESGDLALFHTSSEVQPRGPSTQRRYEAFLRWARTGKTLAYAESWANAWGYHGGSRDQHWCSPCQWNYWRLLVDLHCGVSFIAVYGADLEAAKTEPEFRSALDFAARYAGYHASPSQAPGAWIALRGGEFLSGDYTFLMERLADASRPVKLVGPKDQRYGAWARELPKGEEMSFRVDPGFLAAQAGKRLVIRVVYLDEGSGKFEVAGPDRCISRSLTDSGRWLTAKWEVAAADLGAEKGANVIVKNSDQQLTLHMVEICTAE